MAKRHSAYRMSTDAFMTPSSFAKINAIRCQTPSSADASMFGFPTPTCPDHLVGNCFPVLSELSLRTSDDPRPLNVSLQLETRLPRVPRDRRHPDRRASLVLGVRGGYACACALAVRFKSGRRQQQQVWTASATCMPLGSADLSGSVYCGPVCALQPHTLGAHRSQRAASSTRTPPQPRPPHRRRAPLLHRLVGLLLRSKGPWPHRPLDITPAAPAMHKQGGERESVGDPEREGQQGA